MKKQVSEKVLEYTAVFEPAKEGGYVVTVPALPGCVTEGDSFKEAEFMVKDAIEGYLDVLKQEGQEIPKESSEIVITKVAVNDPAAYGNV